MTVLRDILIHHKIISVNVTVEEVKALTDSLLVPDAVLKDFEVHWTNWKELPKLRSIYWEELIQFAGKTFPQPQETAQIHQTSAAPTGADKEAYKPSLPSEAALCNVGGSRGGEAPHGDLEADATATAKQSTGTAVPVDVGPIRSPDQPIPADDIPMPQPTSGTAMSANENNKKKEKKTTDKSKDGKKINIPRPRAAAYRVQRPKREALRLSLLPAASEAVAPFRAHDKENFVAALIGLFGPKLTPQAVMNLSAQSAAIGNNLNQAVRHLNRVADSGGDIEEAVRQVLPRIRTALDFIDRQRGVLPVKNAEQEP